MKKLFLIATALLLVIMVGFWSCEKENAEVKTTNLTEQKIVSFIEKTKSETALKNGELISLDSVVWYTEAATNYLNYNLKQGENWNATVVDSFFIEIPVTAGQVSFADVTAAFQQIETKAVNIYSTIDNENKNFHFVDVEIDTNYSAKENSIGVKSFVVVEVNTQKIVSIDWIWAGNHGSCDGTIQNWDAAQEFDYVVHNVITDFPYMNSDTHFINVIKIEHGAQNPGDYFKVIEQGNTVGLPEPCILKEDLHIYIKNYVTWVSEYAELQNKVHIGMKCIPDERYINYTYTLKQHKFDCWFGNLPE